jgi:hypothetical protein
VAGAGGDVAIAGCLIAANRAVSTSVSNLGLGGGLYCADAALRVEDCLILDNWTDGADNNGPAGDSQGGGVFLDAGASATLCGCAIAGNRANGGADWSFMLPAHGRGQGGGLAAAADSTPVLVNCRIGANESGVGGVNVTPTAGGMKLASGATLINCVISGNTGAGIAGGALLSGPDSATFIQCAFDRNLASLGGALAVTGAGPVLVNCSVTDHESVAIETLGGTTPTLTACHFHDNNGDLRVGGIGHSGANALNALPSCQGCVDGDPLFVMDGVEATTGAWTAVQDNGGGKATLEDAAAAFVPGALRGELLHPDVTQPREVVVMDNTATSLSVTGLFVLPAVGTVYRLADLRLEWGSAAIDRGIPMPSVFEDIQGRVRPVDIVGQGGPGLYADIGPYEAPPFVTEADARGHLLGSGATPTVRRRLDLNADGVLDIADLLRLILGD